MTFANKPAKWATGSSYVTAPPAARLTRGFEPPDAINPGQMNWLFQQLTAYLNDGQLEVNDANASDAMSIAAGGRIDLDAGVTTDSDLAMTATNQVTITGNAGVAIAAGTGVTAIERPEADEYRLASPRTEVWDFGPARGGYTQVRGATQVVDIDSNGGFIIDNPSAAAAFTYRRPLDLPAGVGGSPTYTLAGAAMKVRADDATSSVVVRLVSLAVTGAAASESVTTLLDTAGSTFDYDDNPAASASLPITLTPGNRYAIEVELNYANTSHTLGVQRLDVSLTRDRL
jgi:hypothetical protein